MPNQKNFDNNTNSPDEEYISGEEYRENLQNLQPKAAVNFNWQQKTGIAVLILFGGSAMVLWAAQFKNNLQINKPLTAEEQSALDARKNNSQTQAETSILQQKDTDQDGLNDYEELYVYNTSPYLEDTDSDGVLDKKEVDQGTDPNCPSGQTCQQNTVASDSSAAISEQGAAQSASEAPVSANNSGNNSNVPSSAANTTDAQAEAEVQKILSGQVDAATLRALLEQAGMSADTLNKISDEQLMKVYEETLKSQGN